VNQIVLEFLDGCTLVVRIAFAQQCLVLLSDLGVYQLIRNFGFVLGRPFECDCAQGALDFVQQVELLLHAVGWPVHEREPRRD